MAISIPQSHSSDSEFEQLALQCPTEIGRGTTRVVFEIPEHPDKVLKVIHVAGNYANWAEMVVYQSAGSHQRFFAQIHSVSWSGKYLVMERLAKVAWKDVSPFLHSFPRYANDRKPSNFGRDSAGNIKMLDYAHFDVGPPPDIPPPTLLGSDRVA